MEFALTGNEAQIQGVSHVIHADMDIDDEIEKIEQRIRDAFEGETAHMISRVMTGETAASFFASAGQIDVLLTDIKTHVRELHNKRRFPLGLRFMNFVNYTPLQAVTGDAR